MQHQKAVLPLEIMLRSLTCGDAGDHVNVCGPYCHQTPVLMLTLKVKETTFAMVLRAAGTQLEKRAIEGFCDDPYPHPPPIKENSCKL